MAQNGKEGRKGVRPLKQAQNGKEGRKESAPIKQAQNGRKETANWEFLLYGAHYGNYAAGRYNDFALPILALAYHWERHWP